MNYKEFMRKAIRCPQFGDEHYGEWGALRYKQRLLIKRLLDECDSADSYIRKLYLEKQELIDYLKEQIKLCKKAQQLALNNKMIEQVGNFNLRIATYNEILSKIEKE